MKYISTRNKDSHKTLSEAILAGLAEDGGLFIPQNFPKLNLPEFTAELSYCSFAQKILHAFFKNDPIDQHLQQICNNAFTFPVPLKEINHDTFMLELFHGPTVSFKDFGARFLAECLKVILKDQQNITVMVATSGDTGSAVASAFYLKPHVNVIILYPKGLISTRQEQQITCWDTNVLALSVEGTFDDCQRLVKSAFNNSWWQTNLHPSSANSINIGRLLPQIVYYAYSSIQFYHTHKQAPGYIVPTGNLGNATAAYWAKYLGFPIREIVLSTNANHVISDYLKTGDFQPRPSIPTVANAMDVGNPSNFERLINLYDTFDSFKDNVKAISVNDDEIKQTIIDIYRQYGVIICPHTATAFFARKHLSAEPWIVVATADPSKFESIIEPVIRAPIPIAPELKILLTRPSHKVSVGRTLEDIEAVVPKSWVVRK